MTRARVKRRPSSTPGVHLDAGARPAPPLPASEFRAVYTAPEQEDPQIRPQVIDWLARLLRRQAER